MNTWFLDSELSTCLDSLSNFCNNKSTKLLQLLFWIHMFSLSYSLTLSKEHTVPLNYNFTFTRVSTRGSRGRCQHLPWKGSFPRDGPWLFHAKTRGISTRRHVAFPRNESWNFHETSYCGILRGIFTRPVVMALKSQWLVKAFTIRNLFTIELF